MKSNLLTARVFLAVTALYLLGTIVVQAWDACGHQVVATIALQKLDTKTREKVMAVFNDDGRGRHFVDAATWPDDIKLGKRNGVPFKADKDDFWHFVDIPFGATPEQIEGELNNHGAVVKIGDNSSANVVTAIRFYSSQLKTGTNSGTEKADALSWLIHLTGDVHQPLHCVNVVTPLANYSPPPIVDGKGGDRGGNGFNIHHPSHELHAFWDDTFDEPTGGRHGEGRDDSEEHAQEVATDLTGRIHPSATELAKMDPAEWAKESYALREFVYSPLLDPGSHAKNPAHDLTNDYETKARAKAEERAVLAGFRLAKLLQNIYGSN